MHAKAKTKPANTTKNRALEKSLSRARGHGAQTDRCTKTKPVKSRAPNSEQRLNTTIHEPHENYARDHQRRGRPEHPRTMGAPKMPSPEREQHPTKPLQSTQRKKYRSHPTGEKIKTDAVSVI